MNNFKVAQIVAQAATDIDEANRDRSVTLVNEYLMRRHAKGLLLHSPLGL